MEPSRRKRIVLAVVAVVLALVAVGIVVEIPTWRKEASRFSVANFEDPVSEIPMSEMQARPRLEEVRTDYDTMLTDVRNAISAIVHDDNWRPDDMAGTSRCQVQVEPDVTNAARVNSPNWSLRVTPTREQWDEIVAAVTPIVKTRGFVVPTMEHSTGTWSVLQLHGRYDGALFSLGYEKAISMQYVSACHLKS